MRVPMIGGPLDGQVLDVAEPPLPILKVQGEPDAIQRWTDDGIEGYRVVWPVYVYTLRRPNNYVMVPAYVC